MPTPELCFVLAPGQNHFFVEVAEALALELRELGAKATVSREGFPPERDDLIYVLVPPHEFRGLAPPAHWPTPRQLERTIFYCFEQPGTKFFDEDVRLAKGPVGAVVDLNATSVDEFARNGVRAQHAPVGWTSAWTFPGVPARDIDLLHLGSYSARRGEMLARSADRLANWRTRLVLGDNHAPSSVAQANFTVDDDKWRLLARSRVLLNIHVDDRPYFEWLRVVQAICNRVLVVSEQSLGTDPLRAGEHFVSGAPEELVALAEPYLADEDARSALALTALDFLRRELPLATTAQLFAELAEEIARRPAVGAGDEPVDWPDNSGIRAEVGAAAAASAAPPVRATSFDDRDDELILTSPPTVELYPRGLSRLETALADDPTAAFAWGMVATDGAAPELRNVFPWQPWRLADNDYIEPPVLWRAAALRALGDESDPALYRHAADQGLRGAHVPEIVGRVTTRRRAAS